MKRLLSLCLVLILLFCMIPCSAYAEDFSDKTDEELIEAYNAIRLELTVRGYKAEEKKVLFEDDNIQIYISDDFSVDDEWYGLVLNLPVVIVNKSGMNLCVQMRNASVNGWSCETMFSADVPAAKKAKDVLIFELEETDVSTISDFEDVEFSFHIFDSDDWLSSFDSDTIHLFAE